MCTTKPAKKCNVTLSQVETLISQFEAANDCELEFYRASDGTWSLTSYGNGSNTDYDIYDCESPDEVVTHLKKLLAPPEMVSIQIPFEAAKFLSTTSPVAKTTGKAAPIVKACREAVAKYE